MAKKAKHVWMVEDSLADAHNTARSFWTKIGVAFENEDGSLTLTLAAIPVTGKMIIRDPTPNAPAMNARMKTPISGKRGVA